MRIVRGILFGFAFSAVLVLRSTASAYYPLYPPTVTGTKWLSGQPACDASGNWVAPFVVEGTYSWISRSDNNGTTWATAKLIPTPNNYPGRCVTDGNGTWLVPVMSQDASLGAGPLDTVYVMRSTDAGATWSGPTFLSPIPGGGVYSHVGPEVAADKAGNWVGAWSTFEALGTPGAYASVSVARSSVL